MPATISRASAQTATSLPLLKPVEDKSITYRSQQPGKVGKSIIWLLIWFRIFWIACIKLGTPRKILKAFRSMRKLRSLVNGGMLKKMYKVSGKYYYNQYVPGWPSRIYDSLIKSELSRHADPAHVPEGPGFMFFAITRKCPMRCEHCFEWDNLNQKESFTKGELYKVVDIYQQQGTLQIHFSGGEPMVRIHDLVDLVKYASRKSECWVLTSGYNMTRQNARLLKEAGCSGVAVSIDHYIPELHDLFRGYQGAFEIATGAVKAAKEAGLVVTVSVCATKSFVEDGHLLPYVEFAKNLGVHFVQVLEPRNVGNYENKNVSLLPGHIKDLEKVFLLLNHHPSYDSYPTLLYHGYHQRRVGCFSGSRSVYVDSAGDVHTCPFCHTSSYNILDIIRKGNKNLPVKENSCPQFNKTA